MKIERAFGFCFSKLLMVKVQILDPPPFSFGFVRFWFQDFQPLSHAGEVNRSIVESLNRQRVGRCGARRLRWRWRHWVLAGVRRLRWGDRSCVASH